MKHEKSVVFFFEWHWWHSKPFCINWAGKKCIETLVPDDRLLQKCRYRCWYGHRLHFEFNLVCIGLYSVCFRSSYRSFFLRFVLFFCYILLHPMPLRIPIRYVQLNIKWMFECSNHLSSVHLRCLSPHPFAVLCLIYIFMVVIEWRWIIGSKSC